MTIVVEWSGSTRLAGGLSAEWKVLLYKDRVVFRFPWVVDGAVQIDEAEVVQPQLLKMLTELASAEANGGLYRMYGMWGERVPAAVAARHIMEGLLDAARPENWPQNQGN